MMHLKKKDVEHTNAVSLFFVSDVGSANDDFMYHNKIPTVQQVTKGQEWEDWGKVQAESQESIIKRENLK